MVLSLKCVYATSTIKMAKELHAKTATTLTAPVTIKYEHCSKYNIWSYMKDVQDGKTVAICQLCSKDLSYTRATMLNLPRHLKYKHGVEEKASSTKQKALDAQLTAKPDNAKVSPVP